MSKGYKAAIIGTGPSPENRTVDGYAMGYLHANSYQKIEEVELVACADIELENARKFTKSFRIDPELAYDDFSTMIDEVRPDIVSICTPPDTHAGIVKRCAKSGIPRAIHCEKPMATNFGDSKEMTELCKKQEIQLTFNHQRRMGEPFEDAKELLSAGAIGKPRRFQYSWGNFFDLGTHCIDLINYFNGDRKAEWVMTQLDYREENIQFGAHNENQILALWQYENETYGLASTGKGAGLFPGDILLVGSNGFLDISMYDPTRVRHINYEEGEEIYNYADSSGPSDQYWIDSAIEDVVDSLIEGSESELSARKALLATEIIFAGYHSARERARIDLPLDITDNPLVSMLESGDIKLKESND